MQHILQPNVSFHNNHLFERVDYIRVLFDRSIIPAAN